MARPEIAQLQQSNDTLPDSGEYIIDPETIAKWKFMLESEERNEDNLKPVCTRKMVHLFVTEFTMPIYIRQFLIYVCVSPIRKILA